MTSVFFIAPDAKLAPIEWNDPAAPYHFCDIERDTGAILNSGTSTLLEITKTLNSPSKPVIIILSGQYIASYNHMVPAHSPQKASSIIPFMMEDQLANAVDDNILSLQAGEKQEKSRLFQGDMIDREIQDMLMTSLDKHNIQPVAIYSDIRLMEQMPSSLYSLPDRLLATNTPQTQTPASQKNLNTARPVGISIDTETMKQLAPHTAQVIIGGRDQQIIDINAEAKTEIQELFMADQQAPLPQLSIQAVDFAGFCQLAREHLLKASVINLQKTTHNGLTLSSKAIQTALMLLVILAMTLTIWQGFTGYSNHSAAKMLEAKNAALLQQSFPQARSAPHALSIASASGQQDDPFVILSSAVFSAIEEQPGITLDSMRYTQQSSSITLSVQTNSYNDLSALKAAVEANGLVYSEGSSQQDAGRITASIVVNLP